MCGRGTQRGDIKTFLPLKSAAVPLPLGQGGPPIGNGGGVHKSCIYQPELILRVEAADSLKSAPSQVWRNDSEEPRCVWMKGRLPGCAFWPHHQLCVSVQVLYFT